MFQVKLLLDLGAIDAEAERTHLKRVVSLPFVPAAGMFLITGGWSCEISEVWWDLDRNRFDVLVDPDHQLQLTNLDTANLDSFSLEEITAELIAIGWQLGD